MISHKDVANRDLEIGQIVSYMKLNYRMMKLGAVIRFTPKGAQIREVELVENFDGTNSAKYTKDESLSFQLSHNLTIISDLELVGD